MKLLKGSKKGFGLLEVLVSAVIVIMILSSLVFIGRRALANTTYYEQRAQAIFLAQESLEEVRQIRDTNWIDKDNNTEWRDFIYMPSSPDPYQCIGIGCTSGYGSSNEFRTSTAGSRTFLTQGAEEDIELSGIKFKRVIKIYPGNELGSMLPYEVSGGQEVLTSKTNVQKDVSALKVEVTVSWTFDGDHSTSASEILTNWRPNF